MKDRISKVERRRPQDTHVDMWRRKVSAMLLGAPLALGWSQTRAQTAGRTYQVIDYDWVDSTRSRPVPARLYWPMGPSLEGTVPLVVFSHGIGGSRQGYSYLGRHWSSHGIASLHVQHVGSDARLWSGNPFGVVGRLQAAAQEQEAIARAADVRFALDRMLLDETGNRAGAVNRQRLIAAGHSYGANTTLLTVGAEVVRDGQTISCHDSRFTAGIIISTPPFYNEPDLAAVLSKVAVPTIHVTATEDVIEIPGYRSGVADRLAVFEAIPNPHKLLAVFHGGSHSMFTDRPLTGGPGLNAKVKIATADLALAFFDLVFERDGNALARWQTNWMSILVHPLISQTSPAKSSSAMRMTRGSTSR